MWPIILFVALVAAACDYSAKGQNSTCISPKANGSTSFSWPQFPEGAKFVYAVDEVDSATAKTLGGHPLDSETLPLVGWWLDYEDVKLSNNSDSMKSNMVTELLVYFANANGSVGGANGCEDLLGKKCIDQINNTIHEYWYWDNPAAVITSGSFDCPEGLFDNGYFPSPRIDNLNEGLETKSVHKDGRNHPLLANETMFGRETSARIVPSGNSSFTYGQVLLDDVTYAEQTNKAAIALIIRHSDWGWEAGTYVSREVEYHDRNSGYYDDELTMTLVCAELPVSKRQDEGSKDDDGDASEGDADNSAISSTIPIIMLIIVAALVI
ncbi:hypothetical protein QQX98_011700 [Neonectria punicea]|uniref:Uncharacterized protein n=1 Tax=Neonectria punicea TaxID=979145 RepID=A0ABR1GKZ2_9HYPO